jgi:hypothetical protein
MKKLLFFLFAVSLSFGSTVVFAQKLESGTFSALKGQSLVNLQYDYSNLVVGKKAEKEYVESKVAEMNKKKSGSGDAWLEAWNKDRSGRYQPAFEKNLNGTIDAIGVKAQENAEATYTLIVRTVNIEPGFQSGVGVSKPAYIDLEVSLVETAAMDKVLGKIVYDNCQSVNMMGYDFDTGARIQSCYDRAGGGIGKAIIKSTK